MTSQVALYNSQGLALASDTVTTHVDGQTHKTTNNAEKIWPLGGKHLVVVAHSGCTSINWVHAQNIVVGWARTLDDPLPTIADYPRSMIDWLNRNTDLLHPDSELSTVQEALNDHYRYIFNRTRWLSNREFEPLSVTDALMLASTQGLEYLESLEPYESSSDQSDAELLSNLSFDLEAFLGDWFGQLDGYSAAMPILIRSAPLILSRQQGMPNLDADLAFVGFGEKDYFGKSVVAKIRSRYGGSTRAMVEEPFGATNRNGSGALTMFAQADAMHGFLRGAQYSLIDEAVDFAWDAVFNLVEGDEDERTADEFAASMRKHLAAFQRNTFSEPMLNTIGGMSLLGLADLAESLVGMQATFASAAGSGAATVGGFIETMLISRAHGVQWLKRLPGFPG